MKHKYNLSKIWEMQKELDATILKSRNRNYEDTFKERSLAFVVELAEFANEARDFKYWSNKKASPRDVLIEEYIDGIHFIVAQGIYLKCKKEYEVDTPDLKAVELTMKVFNLSSQILDNPTKQAIEDIIYVYLQLGVHYKFSEKDLLEHYIKKNKINYQRIVDNY